MSSFFLFFFILNIVDNVEKILLKKKTIVSIFFFFSKDGYNQLKIPLAKFLESDSAESSGKAAVSPMPGVIEKLSVSPGDKVEKGDSLLVMIAMKMEVRKINFFFSLFPSIRNFLYCSSELFHQ